MSLTAARPRTPTPRRSMVPGSGVAVPGVAWLKPILSMKKSHSGSAVVILMTLPTVGKPTVTTPRLRFGARVKLWLLPRLSETVKVSVEVTPFSRSKKKLLIGDVNVIVMVFDKLLPKDAVPYTEVSSAGRLVVPVRTVPPVIVSGPELVL